MKTLVGMRDSTKRPIAKYDHIEYEGSDYEVQGVPGDYYGVKLSGDGPTTMNMTQLANGRIYQSRDFPSPGRG